MSRARTIERCREEVARGELWKARDRLQGLFVTYYFDAEIADLLADVYHRMGDLPQAGKFWTLVDREDERARAGRAAFEARFPDPVARVNQLPLRRGFRKFPAPVLARIEALAAQTGFTGSPARESRSPREADEKGFKNAVIQMGCLFLIAVLFSLVALAAWTPLKRFLIGGR